VNGGSAKVTPVFNPKVLRLCEKPYPGHPNGCPNYGKKETCPPQAPLLGELINTDRPVYVIFNIFPFGEWVEKRRKTSAKRVAAGTLKKPWSQRQLENCLYWQPKARKQLRERVESMVPKDLMVLCTPEACGVDVTATMKSIGHNLEWPPVTVTYQVALVGYPEYNFVKAIQECSDEELLKLLRR
jgi:hypothetical protein